MKLSSISNIQVEPGIYVVYAIFDGNNTYLPKTVTWRLIVNEQATPTPARARQVTDPDYTEPTKRNPVFYFNPTTVTIDETQGGTNEIDLRDYLVNSDNVSYTVTLSNGLEGVDRDIVRWDSSGTYTITVTSEASTLFNSVTSTLHISATRKQDPLIKYENGTGNIIADGNKLVRRYDYIVDYSSQFYGLQFDIELPNNPYSLPLTYSIVDTIEGTTSGTKFYPNLNIWNYSNKYRDGHGAYNKCTIRATFEGDDTYYPATTEYEARIYFNEGQEIVKVDPILVFPVSIIRIASNITRWKLPKVIDYDDIEVDYTVNHGATLEGGVITFGEFTAINVENITVTATSRATAKYNSVTTTCTIQRQWSSPNNEYIRGLYVLAPRPCGIESQNTNYYFTKYYMKKNDSGVYYMPYLNTSGLYEPNHCVGGEVTITSSKGTASFTYAPISRVIPTINYDGTGAVLVQINIQQNLAAPWEQEENVLSFLLVITPETEKKTYNLLSTFWNYDKMPLEHIVTHNEISTKNISLPYEYIMTRLFIWSHLDSYDDLTYQVRSSDTSVVSPVGEYHRLIAYGTPPYYNIVSHCDYALRIVNTGTCTLTITIPATELYNEKVITMNCTVTPD